jgi:cell division protein FtsB
MERLRRRCAAVSVAAARKLAKERAALQAEAARLAARFLELEHFAASLEEQEKELNSRGIALDNDRRLADGSAAKLRLELRSLHAQRKLNEWQINALRDELERLANSVLDDFGGGLPPVVQAA